MLDQDVPPVEEGKIGGVADVVPEAELRAEAVGRGAINNIAGSTPRPWTTVTVQPWRAATTARVQDPAVPASRRIIRSPNPSRFPPCARMRPPASLLLLTIFSFKPRFRKPLAS